MKVPSPVEVAKRMEQAKLVSEQPQERPYHLFARVADEHGWLDGFLSNVSRWLAKKKLPDNVSENARVERGDATLLVLRHEDRSRESAVRIVLRERNTGNGDFTTEIVAVDSEKSGRWLSIKVTNSRGHWVAIPNIAKTAVETLTLVDGNMTMRSGAQMIGPQRVDELVETLASPARRGAVFVAATDDSSSFDEFYKRANVWAEHTAGLAHLVVLQPAAVVMFREALGADLGVDPWTVRTFQPRLSVDDSPRKHPRLSQQRIASAKDTYLRHLLGRFARDVGERLALPKTLSSERHTFDRLENRLLAESLLSPRSDEAHFAVESDATPTSAEAPDGQARTVPNELVSARDTSQDQPAPAELTLEAELDRIRTILHVPDLEDATLELLAAQIESGTKARDAARQITKRLEQLQDRVEELELERDDLREQLDDETLDHAETAEQRDGHARRERWLDGKLAELSSDAAFQPLPDVESIDYPESFVALFERSADLTSLGITLTADANAAAEVDAVDTLGKAARTAWNALLALADYRRACADGVHQGDVDAYLKSTPPGYTQFPPGKHARTETDATMAAYGEERVLPVPTAVDPSGFREMRAHFRLGRVGGMKAPRLYYLDDLNVSGHLVVGYIGTHMRNTQTN